MRLLRFTIVFFLSTSVPFLSKAQVNHNCGTDHIQEELGRVNPQYLQELQDFQQVIQYYSTRPAASRASILTIPVVVHVIHLSTEAVGTGRNLTDARIQAQIQVLNNDYNALNSNYTSGTPTVFQSVRANPEIQFCLATRDPSGNATTGITRDARTDPANTDTIEYKIKPAIRWDPTKYLNVYVLAIPGTNSFGGTLGYAYLPTPGLVGSDRDGVVIDYRWFGAPGLSGVSGACRALSHEVGHYLGLNHIWGSTPSNHVCTDDDGISDTPLQSGPTADNTSFNCSNFSTLPTSCNGVQNMFCNYMDYLNNDACYSMFSQGQVNVMRNVLQSVATTVNGIPYTGRSSLLTSQQTACSAPTAPNAGITAHVTPVNNSIQCGTASITPVVTLRNFSSTTLTAVTIRYTVNGGTLTSFNWTGSLAASATTNVTLAPFTPTAGAFTFKSFTSNPNGVVDADKANDTLLTNHMASAIINLPYSENFSGTAFNPTASNLIVSQQPADTWTWTRNTVSAFGAGSGSAKMDNFASNGTQSANPNGKLDNLVTPTFTFSGVTNATLTFDVAYARYTNAAGTTFSNDTLMVLYSTDCGVTYTNILFKDGGASLGTAPAATAAFTPTSTQWASKSINLSALNNAANVTFAISSKSGWGNNIYIDNINIATNTTTCNLSASTSGSATTCGLNNGTATVTPSGGTTYSYLWSNGNGSTSATISNLTSGTYTVTVTSGNCTATATRTVNSSTKITATIASNAASCGSSNGSATVTPSGGANYTYAWSNGGNTATIANLAAGTYTVTVTSGACTATASTTINNASTGLSVSVSGSPTTCGLNNGTASVTPSGGTTYSYLWSNGNGSTSATISNLTSGTYTVTVTSGNCTATATRTVNSSTKITATIASNAASCGSSNGSATVTPSGGANYTYAWSNGGNTATIANLAAGTYTVTVTSGACTATASTTINNASTGLSVSVSGSPTTCGLNNGTALATAAGGVGYTYFWSNNSTTTSISNLAAGTYTVSVSSNNCTASATYTVAPSANTLSIAMSSISSTLSTGNGTATATVSGGSPNYTYLWSNGANTSTITNLQAGVYTLTVMDQLGCTSTQQVNVASTISIAETSVFSQLVISPIPTADFLFVEATLKNAASIDLAIYSIEGKVAIQNTYATALQHTAKIDVSKLPSGVYILWIASSSSESYKTRFVKQ